MKVLPLSHISKGKMFKIVSLEKLSQKLRLRLLNLGCEIGHQVQFINQAPFNGPLRVMIDKTLLSIRISEAKKIDVKPSF